MRKLLLASAAMLGATAGMVSAQAQSSSTQQPAVSGPQAFQGSVAAPWFGGNSYNNQNNAVADIKNYQGVVVGLGSDSAPLPGTVVIHLHGRVENDIMAEYSTGNVMAGSATSVAKGSVTSPTAAGAAITQGVKLNPVDVAAYMRLYPGVDGMATNGLRYGAQIELRENFIEGGAFPYASENGASVGTNKSSQTVFVNRSYAYIAADNIGLFRIGQADGVVGLFDPCIFSGACWDAGVGVFQNIAGGIGPATNMGLAGSYFVLAQNSAEYGNAKLVYMSPQIAGFELGVQYAPNMGNGFSTCGTNQAVQTAATAAVGAGSGCLDTTTGNELTRWYNQFGVGVRYQGVFGPVAVGAYGFYEYAAIEKENGVAAGAGPSKPGSPGAYAPLSWYEAAAYVKYASPVGTIVASADYVGGAISSGTLTPRPNGGVNESGFQPGLMYNNGPVTLGLSGFFLTSQGSASLVDISQRQENGVALGGNYNVAPGLFLVAEYQYETRHQGGYNFTTNAVGTTTDARINAYFAGVVVTW